MKGDRRRFLQVRGTPETAPGCCLYSCSPGRNRPMTARTGSYDEWHHPTHAVLAAYVLVCAGQNNAQVIA